MAAIQSRFMTPPTNRSPINTQQHPKQKIPCSSPIRNAPVIPARQCSDRKCAGERQCFKHARLIGVSWYTPAAIKRLDPIAGLVVTIIGDNNEARSRPHCARVATTQNNVHRTTYPEMKTTVGGTTC